MFAKATKHFLEKVDPKGSLIPVFSCNDSFQMLSIVIKQKGGWPWQKPKYFATGFTLNDILMGDKPIQPAVTMTDFASYTQHESDECQAGVEATFHPEIAQLTVGHEGTSKHQISFCSLKKEKLDMPKLHQDSKGRVLDMSHSLIQQAQQKDGNVIGLVTQRIMTTQTSTIIQMDQRADSLRGLMRHKILKVILQLNAKVSKERASDLTIQPHMTVAYKLTDLSVELNGAFELQLILFNQHCSGDMYEPVFTWLTKEVDTLSSHFELLSALKASTRASLLQHLVSVMMECGAVDLLESVLSQVLEGKRPSLDSVEVELQRQAVQAILDVLSDGDNGVETEDSSSPLVAFHLITSALAEMPDDCLAVLVSKCTPPEMRSLELLVRCVIEGGEMSLSGGDLAPLTGETYQLTELLFTSCRVQLQRDGDVLRTELSCEPEDLPLLLCIAIKGLASIAQC